MKKWLSEKFNALDSKQKRWASLLGIGAVLVVVGYSGYVARQQGRAPEVVVKEKTHDIGIGKDLLEKSLVRTQKKETEELRGQISELMNRLDSYEKGSVDSTPNQGELRIPPPPSAIGDPPVEELKIPSADEVARHAQQAPVPPPPPVSPVGLGGFRPPPPPGAQGIQPPPYIEEEVGGIGSLTNTNPNPEAGKASGAVDPKKKDTSKRSVYLAPSFFQAELISGGDISTSGQASSNPEPFFLRIQTPAQLPNDVKLRLSGCFVVAEGTGRLDKERAMIRTVSLSCLGKNGESIIDEEIKGYVADIDSKNGLAGKVVSKMGATMARTFLAGMAEGVGKAFETSAQTQTVSGLTGATTSIVDSNQVTRAAVGGGVSEASKTLKEFYLELAKNATPVIEILASRKVTVFVTQGVHLNIKDATKGEEQ